MSDFTTPQTIQYPGSTDTEPSGADAAGNVAGTSFGANDVGFVNEGGNFVKIAPLATNSDANGISDMGLVVGDADGKAITYQVGGSGANLLNLSVLSPTINFSSARAVSKNGQDIVGSYDDAFSTNNQFVDNNGSFSTVPGPRQATANSTQVVAVNNSGEVVGTYVDSTSGFYTPFIYQNGVYTPILVPNATDAYATAVNDSGTLVGYAFGTGAAMAFERSASGAITPINLNVAGATFTETTSINDAGQVVGIYDDAGGQHGFVWYNGTSTKIDISGETDVYISSINDQGEISGTYFDGTNTVGFAEKSLPEVSLTSTGSSVAIGSPVTIAGTALSAGQVPEAGQMVTILDNNQAIGTTTIANDGTFSTSVALSTIGANSITASVTADGVTGTSAGVSYNVFQPVPKINLTSAGTLGPDNTPTTITGTAFSVGSTPAAGQTVTILNNNKAIGTATVGNDGTFSDTLTLPVGADSVTASVAVNNVTGTSAAVNYNVFQAVRDLDATGQEVEHLYYSLLNRAADPTSLAADEAILAKHSNQATKIAKSLIGSGEYRALHGHQSNAQFVEALYEGAFGRPVDAGSLATDVHHLAHGLSRQSLAVSIAQSAEAANYLGPKPV